MLGESERCADVYINQSCSTGDPGAECSLPDASAQPKGLPWWRRAMAAPISRCVLWDAQAQGRAGCRALGRPARWCSGTGGGRRGQEGLSGPRGPRCGRLSSGRGPQSTQTGLLLVCALLTAWPNPQIQARLRDVVLRGRAGDDLRRRIPSSSRPPFVSVPPAAGWRCPSRGTRGAAAVFPGGRGADGARRRPER